MCHVIKEKKNRWRNKEGKDGGEETEADDNHVD